jgi:hypothetical protein
MRKVFAGLATLLMLVVVVQFFLAASGAFNTAPHDESFQPHRAMGSVILLIAVLTTIAAALARVPGRLIGMAGLVAGLAVVQAIIAAVAKAFGETATAGQLVFGLHAINGLVIVALIGRIIRQARALSKSAVSTGNAAGGSGSEAQPAQTAS